MSTAQNAASTPDITREKNSGRFLPGVSPNPGGRAKTAHISEAIRDELDSLAPGSELTNAQAIARRLVKTARDAKRDSQATQAAEVLADRVEGKPMVAMRIEQGMDESTARIIANLYARIVQGQDLPALHEQSFELPQPKALPDVSTATVLDAKVAIE